MAQVQFRLSEEDLAALGATPREVNERAKQIVLDYLHPKAVELAESWEDADKVMGQREYRPSWMDEPAIGGEV